MYYVYILRSETSGELYRGYTALTPEERLAYHNKGTVSSTKTMRPWALVWYAAFCSQDKALQFERYLKSGSGHAFSSKRFL